MENKDEFSSLTILRNRLAKLNIEITFIGNYPWIYLESINGKKVIEKTTDSNHGFNIGWLPVRNERPFYFTNTKEMFQLIRKYK